MCSIYEFLYKELIMFHSLFLNSKGNEGVLFI